MFPSWVHVFPSWVQVFLSWVHMFLSWKHKIHNYRKTFSWGCNNKFVGGIFGEAVFYLYLCTRYEY